MASKQVTDREKSTRFVVASIETHGEKLQLALQERLGRELQQGETMPDVALLTRLVIRALGTTSAALVAADTAHEAELADDAKPRELRDEEAQRVYQTLVDLRAGVAAALGQDGLRVLGIDHSTPSDPSVLLNEGAAVLARLRDKGLKMPPHRRKGVRFDASDFADELEAHLSPLDQALKDVAREVREAEKTLQDKRKAKAAHDEAFSLGASWLSATFSLAGLDDQAERLRPAPRRPGQVEEPSPPEDPTLGKSSLRKGW